MTVSALGFHVHDPADVATVENICGAFAGGFNMMLTAKSRRRGWEFSDSQPMFLRPFAEEGAAMAYPLRDMFRFTPERFERDVVARRAQYAYLHYVGLGFWHAMRNSAPQKVGRIVSRLDPLHGMLCWDGYGFKVGFFDYERDPSAVGRLAEITGYARHVAHQGLGRSLWFRYLGDPNRLIEALESLGPFAPDAASGVGLASTFASINRPAQAFRLVEQFPEVWRGHALLGMTFGYKARALCSPEFFDCKIATLDQERRGAIRAAVAQCDLVESQVGREGGSDGYRRWRDRLIEWLEEHVEYPFAALHRPTAVSGDAELVMAAPLEGVTW
jgi:hypothetical protein